MRVARALGVAIALALAPAVAAGIDAGSPVPALDAPALRAGDPVIALRALRGRVVYVDFWASWCVPCRISMPVLEELARRLGPRGFAVVGVNKDATTADAERFLRRVPVTFALVSDPGDAWAIAFGVKAMPSGYLVDRAGVVRHVHRGFTAQTAATLEREIEALLRE
jgi:thiol-disulfide isomerase/thioredoxin